MKKLVLALALSCLTVTSASGAPLTAKAYAQKPALVLVLVVDQFRADYLSRFRSRFLPAGKPGGETGGYEYLIESGAYYPLAHYDLLQNMTGPGHATVLTGAYPYQMRIPTNYWFDKTRGASFYCAEDPDSPVVGADAKLQGIGLSPRNLAASTVGDELKNAGYGSKVVSIALKDRAAILMGGHRADVATWIDQGSMRWVSSKFYLQDGKLPAWVDEMNADLAKRKGEAINWNAQGKPSGLSTKESFGGSTSITGPDFGKEFPHHSKVGAASSMATPFGLTMTENAAERAIAAYELGKHGAPDLLAVSFSSHDYVGHAFGPNSLEIEEMTVAEDREIAKLLNYVRKNVPGGLKNTLVVLTADHGIPPNPAWLETAQVDAGRISEKKMVADLEEHLRGKFGSPANDGKWVLNMFDLGIYLNQVAAADKKIAFSDLEDETKAFVLAHEKGAAFAFTSTEYRMRRLPAGMIEREIMLSYVPGRSADVIIVQKPYYFSEGNIVDHMSGYSYDRTVPLILAGANVKAGVYAENAAVVDLAPTLSFLLGTVPPTMSEGRVLSEAISP